MEQPQPKLPIPRQFTSSQVLFRFALRLALVSSFATLGTNDFATSFAALSVLSALFCAVMAAARREAIFGPVLTHWDEAAVYAFIGWALRFGAAS
jgi:hypothetical protein